MWKKLEDVHLQKRPGTRFNVYDALFSICKDDTETLSALMARADKALQDIKALHPSNFTLNMLDKELLCMTLIRALPEDYNNFSSSLLLLDSFDIDKLQYAFQNEESQRLARNVSGTSHALHTMASFACFFCGGPHMEKDCPRKKKASEEAKKQEAAEKGKEPNKSFKRKQKAKQRHMSYQLKSLKLKRAMLLKLNLLVMQVLFSLPLIALSGLSLELLLIGTRTQVQHHI
jgi:hypothetical protein